LLDPADRLIVDSSQFDSASDLDLVWRIAKQTVTAPADLNWARIEEWRVATAALFDPPPMRRRLREIANVRVMSGGGASLAELSEALLYVSWLIAQLRADVDFDFVREGAERGIGAVEIQFRDASIAMIRSDRERGVVISNCDGTETEVDAVTPLLGRDDEDLVVRLLKRPEADRVYLATLNVARELAARIG
jgi:glucose-6-phosphate dehydrogenase assembly protein OpcA